MFDSKFIATLFAVAISVFAICNINRVTSNEGFGWLNSTDLRKELIACPTMEDYHKGNCVSVPIADANKAYKQKTETYTYGNGDQAVNFGNMNAHNKGDFFSTENFQSNISPRFDNSGHGPYVRETFVKYNTPNIANMASPVDPISYANLVGGGCNKESFVESYSAENSLMKPNYSEGNYNSLAGGDLLATSDMLPVQNMSSLNGVDKNGQPTQCVFFERIVHSNRNNRRRSQGDMIRGDLPIVPVNNGGWFTTSSSYEDLQQGALNVIGGSSDTSKEMAEFIKNASGGSKTTVGGVDLSTNKEMSTNKRMNTVQVSRN